MVRVPPQREDLERPGSQRSKSRKVSLTCCQADILLQNAALRAFAGASTWAEALCKGLTTPGADRTHASCYLDMGVACRQ